MIKVACLGIIVADVIVKSVDDYPKRGDCSLPAKMDTEKLQKTE